MCPKSSTGNPYEECTSITTTSKITKDFDVDGLPQGGPVDLLADGLEYLPRLLAFLYRLLARGKYYIVCLSLSCLVYLSLYCMLVSLNIAKFSVSVFFIQLFLLIIRFYQNPYFVIYFKGSILEKHKLLDQIIQ